jgi:hypothetical protein
MFTPQALNSELTTDPKGVGYATPLAATNDNAVAALLNVITGPGAATITIPSLTHDEFATLIAPVVMALGSASAALQAQWTPMLNLISGINVFQTTAQNMAMLNALSSDFPNQLPASAITAATTRIGSRAEVLWGVGTVINWIDIAHAMGRM